MNDEIPSPEAAASAEEIPLVGDVSAPETPPVAVQNKAETEAKSEPEPEPEAKSEPEPKAEPAPEPSPKRWYVVKVQSGREESIKEAIERRIKIQGLEPYFGEIYIPTENVTEMRGNPAKRVVRQRKMLPGYIMVQVEYNDDILYLFRETSGVGDFVGGTPQHSPTSMSADEVNRMKGKRGEPAAEGKPVRPKVDRGDRVKVKEGPFAGMEGEVKDILETKGVVRVELPIFGRPVSVELEYWQVELA